MAYFHVIILEIPLDSCTSYTFFIRIRTNVLDGSFTATLENLNCTPSKLSFVNQQLTLPTLRPDLLVSKLHAFIVPVNINIQWKECVGPFITVSKVCIEKVNRVGAEVKTQHNDLLTFSLSNLSSTSCSQDMNCRALNRSLTEVLPSSV